jgi:hypothetical protein
MPYKWNEYVSTYVDPQSVKISETLRTRFMENFKANDELSLAVDQMKAALPFESDVAKKNELQTKINETLDKLAERSDYENLGFAVHRASKEFATAYSPIKENYDRYQAAITALGEQYDKGIINSEQYALAPSYMTSGYKGYEIDPNTGRVKAGTMFKAPTIFKDPKIMDLMTKRLEMLEMKKRGYEEGSIVTDENGTYKRKIGEYTEYIPEQDVMDVYNSVIKEDDVSRYLTQMADMKTKAANASGQTQAVLQANQEQYQKAISEIEGKAALETDEAKKATYQTQLAALQEASNKINAAMQDPALASSMMREYYQEEILQPVKQYAMKKAGLFTYKEESGMTGGGGTGDGSGSGAAGSMVPLYQYDMVRADMDISGTDHKSKMQYAATADQQIQNLTKELADHPEYSEEIKGSITQNINALINNKNRVMSQMKEAADKSVSLADLQGIDKKITDVVRAMTPNASSGDIYNEIQRIFDNAGDQDYMNFQAEFDKQFGQGAFEKHMEENYKPANSSPGYSPYMGGSTFATSDMTPEQREAYYNGYASTPEQVLNKFNGKFQNNINTKYAEIKQSRAYNVGLIETGMGKKTDAATTKAIHGFFEKRGIAQEEHVTIQLRDGSVKQVSGNDEKLKGFVITQVGWEPTNNTFKLNLTRGEGEKMEQLTAVYDGSQIKNEGLMSAMNNPEVRFGAVVMAQRSMTPGIPTQLVTVKINNEPVIINIYSRGDESPYISITKPDGTPFLKSDKEGKATKHNLDEPVIKQLIGSGLVIGF